MNLKYAEFNVAETFFNRNNFSLKNHIVFFIESNVDIFHKPFN